MLHVFLGQRLETIDIFKNLRVSELSLHSTRIILKTSVYLFSSSFTIPEENEESDDWNKGHFFSENSESEQASTIEEENLVSYQSVIQSSIVLCLPFYITSFQKVVLLPSRTTLILQVNLYQKLSFLNQLTHNMTRDCSLTYMKNTSSEHVVYKYCFEKKKKKTMFAHNMLQTCIF